ncbi:MAG: hypothetical protein AAF639_19450 [Chloroflexota bacterium]
MAKRVNKKQDSPEEMTIFTTVDDAIFEELESLERQRVVHVVVWEDSLAETLEKNTSGQVEIDDGEFDDEEPDESQVYFDLDLYLSDGIYFELYGTLCYPKIDQEPWQGYEAVCKQFYTLIRRGLLLYEFAVDEEDSLIIVLRYKRSTVLYLVVGGWQINEWEELPEDAE